jgi:hypothetical protein
VLETERWASVGLVEEGALGGDVMTAFSRGRVVRLMSALGVWKLTFSSIVYLPLLVFVLLEFDVNAVSLIGRMCSRSPDT